MKNDMRFYQSTTLVLLFFVFTCTACGQKKVTGQEDTFKESPEAQRLKALNQKFAKKWIIKKHYHPGALDEGDTASEGEFLHLKADGSYELNSYKYKETGKWKFPTPRPKSYEAMEMDFPLKKEEEILELIPEKKDTRQERTYLIKIENGKLIAIATTEPTSFEAVAE